MLDSGSWSNTLLNKFTIHNPELSLAPMSHQVWLKEPFNFITHCHCLLYFWSTDKLFTNALPSSLVRPLSIRAKPTHTMLVTRMASKNRTTDVSYTRAMIPCKKMEFTCYTEVEHRTAMRLRDRISYLISGISTCNLAHV